MIFLVISAISFHIISLLMLSKASKLNRETKMLIRSNIKPEDMQQIFDFYLKD